MSANAQSPKDLMTALGDHSAEGIAMLSSEPSRLTRATIYVIVALLLAGLTWSFFGKADVIVTALGQLGPESEVRRVYAPIDGELMEIYVSEGMPVAKGDVLARINAVGAIEAATRVLDAQLKLQDAERRYEVFPAQKRAMEQRIEGLRTQIEAEERMQEKRVSEAMAKLAEEQRVKLEKARARLEQAGTQMEFARLEVEKYERLFRLPGGGGVSRQKVEEQRNLYRARATEHQLAEAELAQFEVELNREYVRKVAEIQDKSQDLTRLIAQHQEESAQLKIAEIQAQASLRLAHVAAEAAALITFEDIDEQNLLRIKAPAAGVITEVPFNQPGDKIEARAPLASIAPEGARMVLHIEIEERDRGFLEEGLAVKMKFSAFPYQRYGFIDGTLEYISPATIASPQGAAQNRRAVYKGRVGLERDHFRVEGTRFPLRYGMTATAEIVVRERRLIDLALDPFRNLKG